MRVVLLGPPASGKGTQGRGLAENLTLTYLSTGALLRENVEQRTDLGLIAEPILARGEYLADELMSPILAAWLEENDSSPGWVLDGFPRSLPQALFLDKWLEDRHRSLDFAIALTVPFEELLGRIRGRVECADCRWSGQKTELSVEGTCPECGGRTAPRADDDEANFRSRYEEYTSLTVPVIDFYRNRGNLLEISAIAPREEVSATILSAITAVKSDPNFSK